ncbi:MAG: glycosyltransferase family 4 protein [Spirochaetes bacterium]|nr:glycosyltransferase family 4 protein [Spirochaetota bacterium]
MNIAINARVLNERHGGPARYTMNVIRELAAIDRTNRYHILMYDIRDFDFQLPSNFVVSVVRFRSKLFFDYIFIPFFSWRKRIDIFLFPKNTFSPLVRGKKIPVYHDIVYFEDFNFREFKYFDNLHHRIMIPVAARFSWIDLTVSDFTASRMKSLLNIRQEKIRVVKEGVEDHFRRISDKKRLARVKKTFNLKVPFFFYAGSLSPRKNMLNVIRAFTRIKDSIPHVIYFTGGDSWLDSEVYDMIRDGGLEDRIVRLGYIGEEDLVAMYNLADCYLYPSLYEGFGLPILEAQACGCPVITSNVSSCPEVAGEGALYVNPHDAEDIAWAMLSIVKDTNLKKKLIKAGLQNCRQYTWEKTARAIYRLFLENNTGKERTNENRG